MARLPLRERQAVLLYYLGCRAGLEQAYPHLFSGDAGNGNGAFVSHPANSLASVIGL